MLSVNLPRLGLPCRARIPHFKDAFRQTGLSQPVAILRQQPSCQRRLYTTDFLRDYYIDLGLTPKASQHEIRQAFRALASKHHPDRNPSEKTAAHQRYVRISEAYAVLGNVASRRLYDEHLSARQHPNSHIYGTAHPHHSRNQTAYDTHWEHETYDNSSFLWSWKGALLVSVATVAAATFAYWQVQVVKLQLQRHRFNTLFRQMRQPQADRPTPPEGEAVKVSTPPG